MSTERVEGYREALSNVRSTIQRRISADGVSEDGKLELSNLLIMPDDMLQPTRKVPEAGSGAPEPLTRSF